MRLLSQMCETMEAKGLTLAMKLHGTSSTGAIIETVATRSRAALGESLRPQDRRGLGCDDRGER